MKDDNGATDILELQKALTNSGQGKSDNGAQNTTSPAVQAPSYRYDAAKDPVYQQALQNQQQVQAQAPTYAGTFDQQVKELYDQVMGQKPFAYDLNGDALWQQYKDQYTTQGKMAMMDTMGQAAALTGGYGSSYSQAAGQQAYQGQLQQLNDRVPELYQLALSKYNNDQAALNDKLGAAVQMQADEYSKYQDALNQHNLALDRAQSAADTAYDRGYNAWATEEQLRREDAQTAYGKEQDSYNRLAELITSTGYTPSQSELAAAGMSGAQAAAFATYYKQQQKAARSTGSSSKSSSKSSQALSIPSVIKSELEKYNGDAQKLKYIQSLEQSGTIGSDLAAYMRSIYSLSGFTGTTYAEAKNYLSANGVSGAPMTFAEWSRHKASGNSYGGEHEAGTYEEYLQAYVMSKTGY